MDKMNRRDAFRLASAGLGSLLACGTANAFAADDQIKQTNPALTANGCAWKYAVVDPEKVAKDAYYGYPVGHCMHTVFTAIVQNVAEALMESDPLAANALLNFPFHMFHYGASGGNGWGTLCGAVNGSMAAVSLFCASEKTRKAICDDLGNYYEKTALPIFAPEDAEEDDVPQTVAKSVLCHVSVSKWLKESGARSDSPERTERCSRLSADMAKKAVELLNLNFNQLNAEDPRPICTIKKGEPEASCVKCHNKGGTTSDTIIKMTCEECHPGKTVDHSIKK